MPKFSRRSDRTQRLFLPLMRFISAVLIFLSPSLAHACGEVKRAIELLQTQQAVFMVDTIPKPQQLSLFVTRATAISVDDIDVMLRRWSTGNDADFIRASLNESREIALIGERFGATAAAGFAAQSALRERANRTERMLNIACSDISFSTGTEDGISASQGSAGKLRALSPLSQLTGMNISFEGDASLSRAGLLFALIGFLCALLLGARWLFHRGHEHIYNRKSCVISATMEVDGIAVGGRVTVLGKRGFRFLVEDGDYSNRIFDFIDEKAAGYLTMGRKRLPVTVDVLMQNRCSASFDKTLGIAQLKTFLRLSRVSTHPVVSLRKRPPLRLGRIWLRPVLRPILRQSKLIARLAPELVSYTSVKIDPIKLDVRPVAKKRTSAT